MENKKYYKKRYNLFSKFDEGIRLSDEQWFSVTPESVARVTALQIKYRFPGTIRVADVFGGAAGNAIQLALLFESVIYNEIDTQVYEDAQHNASIYDVDSCIRFLNKDFFDLTEQDLKNVDVIFLSPPWGGPSYTSSEIWDIGECNLPAIIKRVHELAPNCCAFLPRNTNLDQLADLLESMGYPNADLDYMYDRGHCVGMCVYWGRDFHPNDYTK